MTIYADDQEHAMPGTRGCPAASGAAHEIAAVLSDPAVRLLPRIQPTARQLREDHVDKAVSDSVRNQLLSAFPAGTFARVDVLGYGDDPAVEPGDTAIRVFIARAGRPEEDWDSRDTLDEWADANTEGIDKLHSGRLLESIAWIEFCPDTPERQAMPSRPNWGHMRWLGKPPDPMENSPEFARVMTLLGPADLATVDALIVAGVVGSRAEALRWAVGRMREHPADARLQEPVNETSPLRAQS